AHGLGHVLRLGPADADLHGGVAVLVRAARGHDLAVAHAQHAHGHVAAVGVEHARHAELLGQDSGTHPLAPSSAPAQTLISTSTPAARSSFISASTVCGVGSTMSSRRLCVRSS